MINIEDYLKTKKGIVENYINNILPVYNSPCDKLSQAVEYSLFSGGKRFRPILCIATGEVLGGKEEKLLPVACALEFIHNYSLLHDDLPCMDNDDYRRGQPTCHKKFDESTALLAGDGLLTLAFEIIAHNNSCFAPDVLLKVIWELASASGVRGMVGGQAFDLLMKQRNLSELLMLHKMKTGALIRASVRAGALLCNTTEENLSILTAYSENLGLAFQIVDDVLDKDKDNEINSFLSVYSAGEAKEKVYDLTNEAIEYLKPLGDRALILKEIARYFCKRSY